MADDDTDDTEDFSTPALDRITAAMALLDFVADLHDLATNGKAYKAGLHKLRKLEKQVAGVERNIAAATAQASAIVTKAENDVKAIHEDTQRRLDAVATVEADLVERERKIAQLEAAWRNIGEPASVLSGFQAPEFSPLQKARRAHGQAPGKNPDPLFYSEPDAAPAMPIDALSDTSDDPRADRQGTPFLGELTRDTSHHKRRGAA
jgi:hypothetical protein